MRLKQKRVSDRAKEGARNLFLAHNETKYLLQHNKENIFSQRMKFISLFNLFKICEKMKNYYVP